MRATRQALDETAFGAVLKRRTVNKKSGASCENQSVIL